MGSAFEPFGPFLLVRALHAPRAGRDDGLAVEAHLAVRAGDASGRALVVKRPRLGEKASGAAARAVAREGEVLAAVQGAGVVELDEAGTLAALPFVATRFARGATLAELARVAAQAPGPLARWLVARDLARALARVHAAGFVHGDVAPANVLVTDEGDVALVDFGHAARAGEARAVVAGTPGYAAPEVLRESARAPAEDAYACGVIACELITGTGTLFDERELAEAAGRDEPAPSRVPAQVVRELLDPEPTKRPSLEAFAAAADARVRELAARAEHSSEAEVIAAARAELAGAVERALRAEPREPREPRAPEVLTPTAPMVVAPARTPAPALEPTVAMAPVRTPAPEPAQPAGGSASSAAVALRRVLVGIALVAAFAAGVVVRNITARSRATFVRLAAPMPKRTVVEVDGQKGPLPINQPVQVLPGRHVITVTGPKGERREHVVHVAPGSELVVLPVAKVAAPGAAKLKSAGSVGSASTSSAGNALDDEDGE